jgi:serine protease Do
MTEAASNRYPNQTISGAGSGVVFAQSKTENYTYIITNNHVVEGYDTIIVRTTDGKEYNATVVGTDWMTDIAVLRIVVRDLNIATCASSDDLVLGQEVVAIGNPLGQLGGSVSPGYVSGLSRTISIEGIPMTLLQTDAAINPGNSGGGLFDMNGNLIGIVNAKSVGEELDNIGFAIPINTAKTAAAEIIEKGYVSGRADLGFAFGTGITTSGLSIYSYAYNTEVNTEIKQGYLLYSFIIDGKEVNVSSIETYRSILTTLKVGDTVQARIYTPSSTWGGTVYRDSFVVTLKVHEYIPS